MSKKNVGIGAGLLAAAGLSLMFSGIAGADDFAGANEFLNCSSGGDSGRQLLRVVGLTDDNRLVCFNERLPQITRNIGTVSGLTGGDVSLIGIDFRVQDGKLYGVGNAGGVYTLDTRNATATLVNRLTVALSGDSFGIDFNPAADRLRIVSNNGQNLRHNVNAGGVTIADATLNYTPGTPALGIEDAAYTNNDLDVLTGTTLFDLDVNLDQIAIQSPPNNGSLLATGKLQLAADAIAGFDIYSSLDSVGVTQSNRAFGVINVAGVARFYQINVLTGEASSAGRFRDRDGVVDIAVPLNQ